MIEALHSKAGGRAIALHAVPVKRYREWLQNQSKATNSWLGSTRFRPAPGAAATIPDRSGHLAAALVTLGGSADPWDFAGLPTALPRHAYALKTELSEETADAAALGWLLGTYQFGRYLKTPQKFGSLAWPTPADQAKVQLLAEGINLGRDLINTPAEDLGPADLANEGRALAKQHGARCSILVGEKLKQAGYPAIYAVGRAAAQAPRLVDLQWGNPKHPKLTLVGKGVCFDSGGLDLKPAGPMKLMKKDMGGAATVLGLAHVVMGLGLRVRLRVLIPAVENSVSENSFRPLDVLETRKGLRVEVGNTDAEGRLILCDALAEADTESPDLVIDIATLTGAARVALGSTLPALFSNHDGSAEQLLSAGSNVNDPLWRLPLHDDYRRFLDSKVADLNNISSEPYGGAITAALFLREFVSRRTRWMHIDTMAWNLESRPGRPTGGETFGLRALAEMLLRRYGRQQ